MTEPTEINTPATYDERAAERWLDPAEVARLFDVSYTTVIRWANAGHIRFIRTPAGHRKFPASDLLRYFEVIEGRATGAV